MKCPYCNKKAEWVENKEVYGRNIGKSYMIYLCRDCGAYVGCHKNTRNALGSMANKELRDLRSRVHDMIDSYWVGRRGKREWRTKVYNGLSKWWGSEFHVGWLREEDCKYVIENLDMGSLMSGLSKLKDNK
jgi:hypothetical protein